MPSCLPRLWRRWSSVSSRGVTGGGPQWGPMRGRRLRRGSLRRERQQPLRPKSWEWRLGLGCTRSWHPLAAPLHRLRWASRLHASRMHAGAHLHHLAHAARPWPSAAPLAACLAGSPPVFIPPAWAGLPQRWSARRGCCLPPSAAQGVLVLPLSPLASGPGSLDRRELLHAAGGRLGLGAAWTRSALEE